MEQRLAQQLPRSDPVLEAFDRLRLKRVEAEFNQTASAFLAKFQSIAASLQPDERIKIEVVSMHESVKLLKAVLADPQASKVCSLHWWYEGREDVNSIVPLLINNCPELASLEVRLGRHSTFDFVSSVLEHPSNKIKVLEMSEYLEGDIPGFFAALGRSQVSALTLNHSPKSVQGLHEYLAKDLLVRLEVWMNYMRVPLKMMMLLADCTRLAKLELIECEFSQTTVFSLPKSIARLKITSSVNNASVAQIALALKSPNSELRELVLPYGHDAASSIENHLVPALKHPNCNLTKLSFWAYLEHEKAAERMEDMFYNRLALFTLLQGRQVRRLYCPLRRLPVEMFRLVGQVLI
ncbi:hypothetical protein BASA81_011053 [Batrachochytrium salamandrivorans]|nr:hypothetical protein BASA81_011053 [Batrachochytrium salamandrivorans]